MAASATCMANRVGWTRSMPVTFSGAVIASVTENPDSSAISGSICGDLGGEHRLGGEQVGAHRRPTANPGRRTPIPARDRRARPPPDTAVSLRRPHAMPAVSSAHGAGDARLCAPAGGHGGAPGCRRDPATDVVRLYVHPVGQPAGGLRAAPRPTWPTTGRSAVPCGRFAAAIRCRRRGGLGGLLEDGVRVGARHPVRRHRRSSGPWRRRSATAYSSCGTKRLRLDLRDLFGQLV